MSARPHLLVVASATLVLLAVACSEPGEDPRFVAKPPDRASFPPVADLLARRCGSLDCHGSHSRPLRLFSGEGLRLSPHDQPTARPNATTPAEYDADYASVVGLEPEVLTAVVAEGGAHPERLTLVRKARGAEHHKGLTLFNEGDDQDRCLVSWLASRTDGETCTRATASTYEPR